MKKTIVLLLMSLLVMNGLLWSNGQGDDPSGAKKAPKIKANIAEVIAGEK